jgi:hypothetical protein
MLAKEETYYLDQDPVSDEERIEAALEGIADLNGIAFMAVLNNLNPERKKIIAKKRANTLSPGEELEAHDIRVYATEHSNTLWNRSTEDID